MKREFYEMASWWMVSWLRDNFMKWQVDKKTGWPNGLAPKKTACHSWYVSDGCFK